MIDVSDVSCQSGNRLKIRFSDATVGKKDFTDPVARTGHRVQPLKDPVMFARVYIELGALTWPSGYDLDPIKLHDDMLSEGALRPVDKDVA